MHFWKTNVRTHHIELTSVDEDSIHVELCAERAKNEATGRPEHQSRKEDSCTQTNINVSLFGLIPFHSHFE